MNITVKVTADQIKAVIANAWGCSYEDVELNADGGVDVVTNLRGATRAEKIIDKVTKVTGE